MPTLFINYLPLLTTVLSLASAWLGAWQKIGIWPVSILITTLNLFVYYQNATYASFLQNMLSILYAGYGWYQWKYGGNNRTQLQTTTRTSLSTALLLLIGSLLYVTVMYPIFDYLGGKKSLYDTARSALILIGLWLSAHKKVEAYLIWIAVNSLSIYLFYQIHLYWFVLKHTAYLLLSFKGLHLWYRKYQAAQPHTT